MIESITHFLLIYSSAFWDWFMPLIPLGILGAWRWGLWLFRKVMGMRYKITPTIELPLTTCVIVPVYNENPEVFWEALHSWAREKPDEFIAVIDHSDKRCLEVFDRFALEYPSARKIITTKPGKRPALVDGMEAATTDIIALVDSDTIWEEGVLPKLVSPFVDPTVGGVSSRQNVLKPDGLAPRLFDMYLDSRYTDEVRFLAAMGDAITCISGRTAVYRSSAVKPLLPGLINETFWGKKVISGDDKCLTHLVQGAGWKVRYQEHARVFTPAFNDLKTFLKQRQRWSRNSWRADLKAIGSRWIWRHPALAFHLIDRTIQPLTTLFSPAYMLVCLFYQRWSIVLILLIWWLLSRSVKIWPSVRRDPANLKLLPAYVFFSYFFAVIRIYTFFTMNQQGWITRWDSSRMQVSQLWRAYASYGATASVVIAMLVGVGITRGPSLKPLTAFAAESQLPAYNYQAALAEIKHLQAPTQLIGSVSTQGSYTSYQMKPGDNLELIAHRYGLPPNSILASKGGYDRDETLLFKPPFVDHDSWIQQLQQPIVTTHYQPTSQQQMAVAVYYDQQADTIVVAGSSQLFTLSMIWQMLNDDALLSNEGNGVFLLKKKLLLTANSTLVLQAPEVSWLKLRSEPSGFVSLVGDTASIVIDHVKINSWDASKNGVDEDTKDGRAYLLLKNGRMDITNSELSYLGHPIRSASDPAGVYGIAWRVEDESQVGQQVVTGYVANNKIHHNYFGLYTYAASWLTIQKNEIFANVQYGIDAHSGSNNLLIEENYVHHNNNHGIILSRNTYNNLIRKNRAEANRLHGILLDRNSDYNIVEENILQGNFDGLGLWDSHNNAVHDNQIVGNKRGIRLDQKASSNAFYENSLSQNSEYGIYLFGDTKDNWFWQNRIESSQIGIYLRARENKIWQNQLVANQTGIYLTESASANQIAYNTLSQYEIGIYLKTQPDDFLAENQFDGGGNKAQNLRITGAWQAIGVLQ